MEAVSAREAGPQQLQPWEAIGKRRGGEVIMGKLLRFGGVRRCRSLAYTPWGYIFSIPLGVYFQWVEGAALTRGRVWSPSSLTVGRGQREAEGKDRSATGAGGGGGESAAVGLDQCLGDGQTDTGSGGVPAAGGIPR